MQRTISEQGRAGQLTPVAGGPSGLREGIVRTVEPNGSVAVEMMTGRSGVAEVAVPAWYRPALGDRVLVGELNGDPASPVVIAPREGALRSRATHAAISAPEETVASLKATVDALLEVVREAGLIP